MGWGVLENPRQASQGGQFELRFLQRNVVHLNIKERCFLFRKSEIILLVMNFTLTINSHGRPTTGQAPCNYPMLLPSTQLWRKSCKKQFSEEIGLCTWLRWGEIKGCCSPEGHGHPDVLPCTSSTWKSQRQLWESKGKGLRSPLQKQMVKPHQGFAQMNKTL